VCLFSYGFVLKEVFGCMYCQIYLRILWRSKLIGILFAFVLVVLGCAFLSAMFSGRQPATVGLDVAISVVRILLPLAAVLMMQELFSREFERRYFLISLAYPYSRSYFLFSRFAVIVVLLIVALLIVAASLWFLLDFIAADYSGARSISFGLAYWLNFGFVLLDLLVVSSVALLLAVVASTSSFVLLGSFGFMFIARSYAAIIKLIQEDVNIVNLGDVKLNADVYISNINVLSYFLPDLGALDVRSIALYDYLDFLPSDWPALVVMATAYIIGFLALARYALTFKRFS